MGVNLKMLEDFCQADGISGFEKEATRVMKSYLEGYADEISYDNLGSIIGLKKGKADGLKLMIAGHIDEVGFIVKGIDDKGFVKLHPIGGWWGHVLLAQPLTIITREGKKLPAVVAANPPHGMPADARNKVKEIKDISVDLGVANKEEALALGINIGDPVVPKSEFTVMNNPKFVLAKAWDDRVGAAIATQVVRNLKDVDHDANVYAVGTVQEEVGLRGARTSAALIKPDIGIAIDVTMGDTPGSDPMINKLGSGVALSVADGSVIGHTGLLKHLEGICKELEIPFTHDMLAAGGTDSGAIHITGEGVVTLTLSIPSRYFHSHRSMIHLDDYEATVNLVTEFCKKVTKIDLEAMKADKR